MIALFTMSYSLCTVYDDALLTLLYQLPISEICQLRLVCRNLSKKIFNMPMYRLVFLSSADNEYNPNSVPILLQNMFVNYHYSFCEGSAQDYKNRAHEDPETTQRRLNSKLALNAAFRQDMELVQYALNHSEKDIYYINAGDSYELKNAVKTAVLMGRPTQESMSWVLSNLDNCSIYVFILQAFAVGLTISNPGILSYNSLAWIKVIEHYCAEYDREHDSVTRWFEYQLVNISLFCACNGDLETATLALSNLKQRKLKFKHENFRSHEGMLTSYFRRLFKKNVCVGDSQFVPHVTEIIYWVTWIGKTFFSKHERDYECLMCKIAFESERHDILDWLDETYGLKTLLMINEEKVHKLFKQAHILVLRQIVERLCARRTGPDVSILDRIFTITRDPPEDPSKNAEQVLLRCIAYLPLAATYGNEVCVDWFLKLVTTTAAEDDYMWIKFFLDEALEKANLWPNITEKIQKVWNIITDKLKKINY